MPSGIYLIDTSIQATGNNLTYTRYYVRIRKDVGIFDARIISTLVPSQGSPIQPVIYFGGENRDILSIMTTVVEQNYEVHVLITQIAS